MFFTFFKLYKWYQIAQLVTNAPPSIFHLVLKTHVNGITNFVTHSAQKFSIKGLFSECDKMCSLLTFQFTEEILNGKLQFFVQWRGMNGVTWALTLSESVGCLVNVQVG